MRVAAVLVSLIVASGAAADTDEVAAMLARAKELEARLAYDDALQLVEQAIIVGGSDQERFVALHLLAGRLAAGLDRAKVAEDHFAVVLAVAPQTPAFPDGTSPKITEPFAAARARTAPLEVKIFVDNGLVTIAPVADPLQLVAAMSVRFTDKTGASKGVIDRKLQIATDPAATVTLVEALDRNLNIVWSGRPPAKPPIVEKPPIRESPSLFARWTTWAAITTVAIGAGGVAAWRFDNAQREWDQLRARPMPDFGELADIETRGRRWGLAANISFGVAAATGLATIYLAVRGSGDSGVAVTPGPGAGVGLAGRF